MVTENYEWGEALGGFLGGLGKLQGSKESSWLPHLFQLASSLFPGAGSPAPPSTLLSDARL